MIYATICGMSTRWHCL